MNKASGKKMLICSIGIPHKSVGASLVLLYHYISLLKKNGFKILHLMLLQPDYDKNALLAYSKDMCDRGFFEIIAYEADRYYKIKRLFPKINILSLNSETVKKIKDFNTDYILCFDILSAGVLFKAIGKESNAKKIVWLGDLNFQTYWYHALYDVKENFKNILHIPSVLVLSLLWRKFYKTLLRGWEQIIVSSKSSEKELRKLGLKSTYLPYPWPVLDGTSKIIERKVMPSFAFFGTLTGLGSRSAFHFLINLYKKLTNLWGKGKFQILICGSRGLPKWVEKKISTMAEIKYLGFVDNLNELLVSCHGVIIPIDVPVGNRSRIVTAMAAGALVIAHKNTALGNPELINGKTCYLANYKDDFVKCIKNAYENTEENKIIIKNARDVYNKTFRPDVAGQMLIDKIL